MKNQKKAAKQKISKISNHKKIKNRNHLIVKKNKNQIRLNLNQTPREKKKVNKIRKKKIKINC